MEIWVRQVRCLSRIYCTYHADLEKEGDKSRSYFMDIVKDLYYTPSSSFLAQGSKEHSYRA